MGVGMMQGSTADLVTPDGAPGMTINGTTESHLLARRLAEVEQRLELLEMVLVGSAAAVLGGVRPSLLNQGTSEGS